MMTWIVKLPGKDSVLLSDAATRADQSAELNFPADWNGDPVEIYLGFVSADGTSVATSLYLGQNTVI